MKMAAAAMRMTTKMELDDHDFSSFSTSSDCPSAGPAFLAIDIASHEAASHRRESCASSAASSGQDFRSSTSASTASPSTPLSVEYMNIVQGGDSMTYVPNELDLHGMDSGWKSAGHGVDPMWMAVEPKYHNSAPYLDFFNMETLASPNAVHESSSSDDWHLLSTSAANLSFSRGILDEHQASADAFSPGDIGHWIPTIVHTQPETVVPSATFRPTLASSSWELEPLTPLRYQGPALAGSTLSASPSHLYSPVPIPAQTEYERAEHILETMPVAPKHEPKARRRGGRSGRPSHEQKCFSSSGRIKSSVRKSAMVCDVIIEGNKYACEFVDCMDKNGKRKMFKRREHAKRHVDTVHLKKKQFPCWVPGCTTQPFTRSDNLTTHLKSTHGKKSVSSRNRYVSTLDPASENFDPEWRGDLDDNGYPVDSHRFGLKSVRSRL